MDNKRMKRCSTSFIVKEMSKPQKDNTSQQDGYHKKMENKIVGENVGQLEPSDITAGNVKW